MKAEKAVIKIKHKNCRRQRDFELSKSFFLFSIVKLKVGRKFNQFIRRSIQNWDCRLLDLGFSSNLYLSHKKEIENWDF